MNSTSPGVARKLRAYRFLIAVAAAVATASSGCAAEPEIFTVADFVRAG